MIKQTMTALLMVASLAFPITMSGAEATNRATDNDSTTILLREQNALLREQIAELRKQNATLIDQTDALADEMAEVKKEHQKTVEKINRMPKVSGYMQLLYDYGQSQELSSITVKRARLKVSGALAKNLTYAMQVEFASPKVLDFYFNYQPWHQFGVKAGMFKLPFTIENTVYSPLIVEAIEAPVALAKLVGFNDVCGMKNTGRDLGINFQGGFFPKGERLILNYDLGVFNGNGVSVTDNNKRKDINARLIVKPLRSLQLSGAYYWGSYGTENFTRNRWNAAACWDNHLILRGEVIGGTTGMANSEGLVENVNSLGYYIIGGWHLPKHIDVVARYDGWQTNMKDKDTRLQDGVIGLAWNLPHFRAQANYIFTNYYGVKPNNHSFQIMLTGMF